MLTFTILFACSNRIKAPKAIGDGVKGFIEEQIAMRNNPEGEIKGPKIIDSKITKLERLTVFDNILEYPIELWNLEFKLKIDDNSETAIGPGMIIEDGWLTEDNGMGKSCIIFKIDGDNTSVLDVRPVEEFNLNSLSKQEIRVRQILTDMDFLPNGAYEGNHIIIRFPVFEHGHIELFLSQPVIQGEKGMWAVEKWKEENSIIHNVYPGIDARRTDISIGEKYQELQDEFSSGKDLSLGEPVEVAMSFIKYKLRQIYSQEIDVEVIDLEIIDPATMEDFVD